MLVLAGTSSLDNQMQQLISADKETSISPYNHVDLSKVKSEGKLKRLLNYFGSLNAGQSHAFN